MLYRLLLVPVLLVTGVVAGYLLALSRLDPASAPPPETPAAHPTVESGGAPGIRAPQQATASDTPVIGSTRTRSAFERAYEFHRLAEPLDAAGLQQQLATLLPAVTSFAEFERAKVLVQRLVDRSGAGAIRFLTSTMSPAHARFRDLLRIAFRALAEADEASAIAELEAITDTELRKLVLTDLLANQLITDLQRLHQRLPQEAKALAPMVDRVQAAAQGAREAFAGALAREDQPGQFELLSAALARWAEEDASAALKALEAVKNPDYRRALAGRLLIRWASQDPEAALAAARALGADATEAMGPILAVLGNRQPELALRLAAELTGEFPGVPLLNAAVGGWAQRAPQEAAEWVETRPEAERNRLGVTVATYYQSIDAAGALQWALRLDPPATNILDLTARHYARQQPEELLRVAEAQPAGQTRDLLLLAAVQARAEREPAQTATWIERFRGEESFELLQDAAVTGLMRTNPEAAASHVRSLAPSEARDRLLGRLAAGLAYQDAARAAELIDDMSASGERDAARFQLARALMQSDPEQAMAMADRIGDPQLAKQSRIQTVLTVRALDPERASDLARRHGLTREPALTSGVPVPAPAGTNAKP